MFRGVTEKALFLCSIDSQFRDSQFREWSWVCVVCDIFFGAGNCDRELVL